MELEQDSRKGLWTWIWLLLLAGMVALSLYLAATRFLTVDDFQNVYMARVLATGRAKSFFTNGELYLIPLGWATRFLDASSDILRASRMLFAAWFWLNLGLLVRACGIRLLTRQGLLALFLAGLLAPLWINGYEVRHDNILLTWILLFWILVGRPSSSRPAFRYAWVGFLTVLVQFSNFKSIAYWVPCTFLALVVPNPAHGRSRKRLLTEWLGGAGAGILAVALVYGLSGGWDSMAQALGLFSRDVQATVRFSPATTLGMLFQQAPLLVAGFAAFLWLCAGRIRQQRKAFFTWETWAPELVFALLGISAFLVNPNPYSYNLLLLVPQLAIASALLGEVALPVLREHREFRAAVSILLVLGQGIPFAAAIAKHFQYTNARQLKLITLAEAMTDPGKDRVYDSVGMVPTRDSIMRYWAFNSMNVHGFRTGEFPEITEALQKHPPAVVLPNFRITWLPQPAMAFLHAHYVPLALDYMVLGARLPEGKGSFECIHPGRYALVVPGRPGAPVLLDGKPAGREPVELGVGLHTIAATEGEAFVVWVGPVLDSIPQVGQAEAKSMDVLGI